MNYFYKLDLKIRKYENNYNNKCSWSIDPHQTRPKVELLLIKIQMFSKFDYKIINF